MVLALALLRLAHERVRAGRRGGGVRVYLLGNWPAPFGIVLVLDRLSALMVVLTAVLGLAALVFSLARWHRAGAHFHPLFQFQLMGLNGAFLTGDLFNLFVFFEVMLAASYGLVLHGSAARVRAGLHYIAINLAASLLFLIGVSWSTASRARSTWPTSPCAWPTGGGGPGAAGSGAAVLGVAFLVKAAMWPLGFWLPATYAAASAPAAAMFSILTKVGVYAVLRLWLLLFGAGEVGAASAAPGCWGGLATIAFGRDRRAGVAEPGAAGRRQRAGLLRHAAGGDRRRPGGGDRRRAVLPGQLDAGHRRVLPADRAGRARARGRRRRAGRDAGSARRGRGHPRTTKRSRRRHPGRHGVARPELHRLRAAARGLPPLSGFVAKFAMLAPLFARAAARASPARPGRCSALLLSGLAAVVAMVRAGVDAFWASARRQVPRVGVIEIAPVALLLALCWR